MEETEKRAQRPFADRAAKRGEKVADVVSETMEWFIAPPFLPQETRRHLYAARKEMLLAARSLIDRSIQRVDDLEKRREASRPTKIPVE